METAMRAYRAVFFDLDGTLLPMEIDEFLNDYYHGLAAFMVRRGIAAEPFLAALNAGIRAMMGESQGRTNEQVFWDAFLACASDVFSSSQDGETLAVSPAQMSLDAWEGLLTKFYDEDFGRLGDASQADPSVAQAIATLRRKGYPLVLATMPLFPPSAVAHRLRWAGLDPADFERLTTYDNSTSVKPRIAYCAENLAAAGLRGQDVLMVGNNTLEDMSFANMGCDIYIVTNDLLDPVNFPLEKIKHGTRADFAAWVQQLPPCACPARAIHPGRVDPAACAAARKENCLITEEEERQAQRDFIAAYEPHDNSAESSAGR